jgi:hypothetical protein
MARYESAPRPKRKTPAERSDELTAASRLLKEESAARRNRAPEDRNPPPAPTGVRRG